MDIMQVKDLTFIHNERKRWLKRPEVFQLGPVNLSVKRGETIAIIGENRSGKSLLAKLFQWVHCLLMQVKLKLTHKYLAKYQSKDSQQKRTHDIRMILQHSSESMNPSVPVGKILDEPLRLNTGLSEAERKPIIEDMLVKVGLLREHYYFYRHMLSDGQQQRVALAEPLC